MARIHAAEALGLHGATDQARARGRLTRPGHCFRGTVRALRPLSELGFAGQTFERPLEAGRRDVRGGSVYQQAKLILSSPTSICRSVLAKRGIARGGPRMLGIPVRVPLRSHHSIITEARDRRHTAVGGSVPRPAPAMGSGLRQCQPLGKVPPMPAIVAQLVELGFQ